MLFKNIILIIHILRINTALRIKMHAHYGFTKIWIFSYINAQTHPNITCNTKKVSFLSRKHKRVCPYFGFRQKRLSSQKSSYDSAHIRAEISNHQYWENVFILLFVWLVVIGFRQNYFIHRLILEIFVRKCHFLLYNQPKTENIYRTLPPPPRVPKHTKQTHSHILEIRLKFTKLVYHWQS